VPPSPPAERPGLLESALGLLRTGTRGDTA
ncbi:MAG: hypothetical protein QOJ21_2860, partial [Solirubrobacteraceae bacterium]|nr:hypothetical protein [Solirubrobacteraceae bacterium]